jgi:hypothetical protein
MPSSAVQGNRARAHSGSHVSSSSATRLLQHARLLRVRLADARGHLRRVPSNSAAQLTSRGDCGVRTRCAARGWRAAARTSSACSRLRAADACRRAEGTRLSAVRRWCTQAHSSTHLLTLALVVVGPLHQRKDACEGRGASGTARRERLRSTHRWGTRRRHVLPCASAFAGAGIPAAGTQATNSCHACQSALRCARVVASARGQTRHARGAARTVALSRPHPWRGRPLPSRLNISSVADAKFHPWRGGACVTATRPRAACAVQTAPRARRSCSAHLISRSASAGRKRTRAAGHPCVRACGCSRSRRAPLSCEQLPPRSRLHAPR